MPRRRRPPDRAAGSGDPDGARRAAPGPARGQGPDLAGLAGLGYSRLAGEPVPAFLSSAFTKLGSGFVGAAVTFVLFQSLLTRRTNRTDDPPAELTTPRAPGRPATRRLPAGAALLVGAGFLAGAATAYLRSRRPRR